MFNIVDTPFPTPSPTTPFPTPSPTPSTPCVEDPDDIFFSKRLKTVFKRKRNALGWQNKKRKRSIAKRKQNIIPMILAKFSHHHKLFALSHVKTTVTPVLKTQRPSIHITSGKTEQVCPRRVRNCRKNHKTK
jgi:hypothetical protein